MTRAEVRAAALAGIIAYEQAVKGERIEFDGSGVAIEARVKLGALERALLIVSYMDIEGSCEGPGADLDGVAKRLIEG